MDTNDHQVNKNCDQSCSIGERIREERVRLNFSQAAFAGRVGVHRRTQINYEKGDRKPDTDYLQALAESGVDVGYVLTGSPSQEEAQVYASALDIIKAELGVFKGDFHQAWDAALAAVRDDWRALRSGGPEVSRGDVAIRSILKRSPLLLPGVYELQDAIERLEFVIESRQVSLSPSKKAETVVKLLQVAKEQGLRTVDLALIDALLSKGR